MDRLRRIELLVRAAEAGSFARAAALMRIDPSAVSHAIAQLERSLGATLFFRTTRRLRLTEEGEEVYRRGTELLRSAAELEVAARPAAGAVGGTLRIAMAVPISRHIVMPHLPGFLERFPGLAVECLVLTAVTDMHAGGIDVMVRAGEPPDASLIARKLADMRFGVYAAPSYLAAAGELRTPEDLLDRRCLVHKPPVAPKPWDEWVFERRGERKAIQVRRALVTDDREGLIAAVLAGGGLMRIGMFDPGLIASGQLRRVLDDWTCVGGQPVYALYRRSARLPPKIAVFLKFLADAFARFDTGEATLLHDASVVEWALRLRD